MVYQWKNQEALEHLRQGLVQAALVTREKGGSLQEARKHLEQALTLEPDSAAVGPYWALANVYADLSAEAHQSQDFGGKASFAKKAVAMGHKALDLNSQAPELHATQLCVLHTSIGFAYAMLKEYKLAKENAEKALTYGDHEKAKQILAFVESRIRNQSDTQKDSEQPKKKGFLRRLFG